MLKYWFNVYQQVDEQMKAESTWKGGYGYNMRRVQRSLKDMAGLKVFRITDWETGKLKPIKVKRVTDALNVTYEDLFQPSLSGFQHVISFIASHYPSRLDAHKACIKNKKDDIRELKERVDGLNRLEKDLEYLEMMLPAVKIIHNSKELSEVEGILR